MVTHLDVKVGQLYSLVLPDEETPVLAEFKQETRHDTFLFARERTDRPIELDCDVFEKMRNNGTANRITLRGDGRLFRSQDLDPTSLLDPDEPSITLRERDRRLKALEKLHRARTLRFYVTRYDESSVGRGHKAIGLFTKENYPDALELGFHWRPDAATILRSVDRHGSPGSRPLTAFFEEYRQHDRSKRWAPDVLKAADDANVYFWSARAVGIGDAIAQFTNDITNLKSRWAEQGHVVTDETFAVPSDETLRTWIREKSDWYHWASKYGKRDADRRFRGRGRIIDAPQPLEYVMIDHTMLDAWAVITDDEGEPLFAARAWLTLAIDCYSRMIVGAVIGYERPSVHSAMTCLRQVIRSKDALHKEYGYHKGATDGYGRPFTVIVDNGWEFTGKSFQTSCEAAGINVMWAPVKVPMFKAYVERFFGTLNSMLWHKIPGGIPLTVTQRRTLELEPEADVVYTRTQLESAMWSVIVRRYHLETHTTINMAPARKWRKGIQAFTRPTIDNIAALDRVVGRAEERQLSAEGIFLDGERFHDQEITTGLLNRLAARGKERDQRNGALSTRTVEVLVFADPGDASKVHVWDPTRKEAIALPNWNRLYCQGLPWHAVRKIREYANEQNLAFHSDKERAAARIAHRDYLLSMLPKSKLMQGRKHAQIIEPMPQLASGDVVQEVDVSDEVQGYSVAHDIAAHFTVDLAAAPGRRRGGRAATAKAQATKEENRQAKAKSKAAAQPENKPVKVEQFETIAPESVNDADDFMAAVRAQLEADNQK